MDGCVDAGWVDALMMGGLWMLDALVNECVDEFVNAPSCRGVDALYRGSEVGARRVRAPFSPRQVRCR